MGRSMETTIAELAPYLRGWRSYFGFCETPAVLEYLTRWVRLRLRAAMWRQWKELYKVLCNRPSEEENRHRWQSTTY